MMIVNEWIPHHQVLGLCTSAHAFSRFNVRPCNNQVAIAQIDALEQLLRNNTRAASLLVNIELGETFMWNENACRAVKPSEDQRAQAAEHPCAVCDDDVVIAGVPREPSRKRNADAPATCSSLEVAGAFYKSDVIVLGGSSLTELIGKR